MFQGLQAEEYYGPPNPGQSFTQYNTFMSTPIVIGMSGAAIGALIAGPVGAVVGGIGSWLLSGSSERHTSKPKTQGG